MIDWTGDGKGGVLMTRQFVPEFSTGTMLANTVAGLGVEKVDTGTLSRNVIERPRPHVAEYISDGRGNVRVMGVEGETTTGYSRGTVSYLYRKAGSNAWLPLGRLGYGSGVQTGFNPMAVDPEHDRVIGFDDAGGRRALYAIALDGSMKRELLLARPDVDVDGTVRIGRQQRVVGASYATEQRQTEFFDPDLKALRTSLGRALPKAPIVTFTDASADEKKLVLLASSDVDPGTYYLLDRPSRHMEEILPIRPPLAGRTLAVVRPVTCKAADGTSIPAYLTLPPGSSGRGLPAIVMPHGGPGARDEWGFDWLAQFFAARGFAVLQPNFRGSSGYGSAWFQKNGFQSWRTAIGDVNDAGRWLVAQGIAEPKKLAIVGWSYGGYAALQSAVLDPDLYKAIVAVAPVTDLETLRGESEHYMNYAVVSNFIGTGPHVREGSPARNVQRIKAPVLLFHGTTDRNVGVGESRLMASALRGAGKQVDYVEYKGLDHQLDDDDVRTELLAKSDAFLRKALGLPAD